MRLSSVDLPTLVRPPSAMKPARCAPGLLMPILTDATQRGARGRLLALLLAAALPHPEVAAGDANPRGETFGMVGAAGRDQLVERLRAETAIGDLLQLGLVVAFGAWSADIVNEEPFHHVLRRHQSTVGINRAYHRLEGR